MHTVIWYQVFLSNTSNLHTALFGGNLCGVMAKVLDCSLKVREFEYQLHYYVHSQTNTLEKEGMNPFILWLMDKIESLLFFYKDGFSIK